MIALWEHQKTALCHMHNGCILCGGVGSGKSATALAYYHTLYEGELEPSFVPMQKPKDLYIITTARKRDTLEWEGEMIPFLLSCDPEYCLYDSITVKIDSWNNIKKYADVEDAFFIFDEDKVTGYGTWAKTFIKITKSNQWIILSATPGDKWTDYIAVFIANGFYKNKRDFEQQHIIYRYHPGVNSYPQIDRYINLGRLIRLRDQILVDMPFKRHTTQHHEDIWCEYDRSSYKLLRKERWNPYEDRPIENASELCYLERKIINSDESRALEVLQIKEKFNKVIIFYNYDFELEILKNLIYGPDTVIAEWNSHKHQPVPEDQKDWVYLTQYIAGCEAWNCISTNCIIFYSQTYSYKQLMQATGRIDRNNTGFKDLYYFHLKSHAPIDLAIGKALAEKKDFNEGRYYNRGGH